MVIDEGEIWTGYLSGKFLLGDSDQKLSRSICLKFTGPQIRMVRHLHYGAPEQKQTETVESVLKYEESTFSLHMFREKWDFNRTAFSIKL